MYLTLFLLNTNMLPGGNPAAYADQPPGYRFPCAKLVQNTIPRKDLPDASTARIAFHCVNLFTFTNGLPDLLLYDMNVAGLPAMS